MALKNGPGLYDVLEVDPVGIAVGVRLNPADPSSVGSARAPSALRAVHVVPVSVGPSIHFGNIFRADGAFDNQIAVEFE